MQVDNAPLTAPVGQVQLGELVDRLGLVCVAGPREPGRPLRWAHPTELLRPARYLRGGELVLTVGSSLTSPRACDCFVADLAGAGVAALGFGTGDVHDTVPQALACACDAYGVPLLAVPPTVPFQTLTELLADRRVAARLASAQRVTRLVAVVLDALAGRGPDVDALALLAGELGGQLTVTGPGGLTEAVAGDASGGGPPLVVDLPGDPPGRLWWCPPGDAEPGLDAALPDLAHAVALWRRQRAAAARAAEADLGRLLQLVLDGMAEPAALRARLAPLDSPAPGATGEGIVTTTAWDPGDAPIVRAGLEGVVWAALDDAFIGFVGSPQAALQRATDAGLPCGVGGRAPLGALAGSVREAMAGLALSRRRGRPVTARELATLDALLDQVPDARLRPFVAQLLEPLAAHDRATGARLLPTLQAFIDGGAAVVPVARSLYLHPNTLRYRLHRIAQLTERDPLVPADRVDFVVALRAADRRGLLRRREG